VLVVIAALYFLLRPTTADLDIKVTTDPPGVPVRPHPHGARRHAVPDDVGRRRRPVRGVSPSDHEFELQFSARGYFDGTMKVPISEPKHIKSLEVVPIPMPGTGEDHVEDPPRRRTDHGAGRIALEDGPARDGLRAPEVDKERVLTNIPAGEVTATATRPGFKTWTGPQDAAARRHVVLHGAATRRRWSASCSSAATRTTPTSRWWTSRANGSPRAT
jgi:hypothetical protein